ncbi:MAG: hypothetical protein RI973_1592 [Bacteroidota bacterium]|jgi:iron complex outermembrane receptor protein
MKQILLLVLCLTAFAGLQAQHTVSGTVTGENGEVLIGATILEKGTNRGTVSDADGSYSLNTSAAQTTLIVSYIGYTTQEVAVDGQTSLNIVLSTGIDLGEVQIIGSRSLRRTVTNSPVAIDLIDVSEIAREVGQLEVNQMLQYVAPSFNASRQSGADGADHIDPATLRGLGPDQTLVLVNGKRRHQSSLVNIFGSRGRGNTGTDLNAIPASAIERIEILRDGASAQYGSDAIAGVINVVLKSNVEEGSLNISTGMYKADPGSDYDVLATEDFDGQSLNVNANYGLRVGKEGFVNFTMDYLTRDRTNRPADPNAFDIYRQKYGDAAADAFSGFLNAAVPVGDNSSFYLFGGYSHRYTDAFAWTRSPDSERNVPAIYPDGFNPRITSNIGDQSVSAGVRTKYKNWDIDINNTFGQNRFHYIIDGTLNASLLERSPTRFDAGGFQLSQNTSSINFSQYFDSVLKGANLAFGMEHRLENYEIFAGEEGSWRNYGIVEAVDANGFVTRTDVLGRPGGSQGFPGFQPADVLSEFRTNLGLYVDAEFDLSDKLMVAAAARYEHYSDFGSTLNGKLAARLSLSKGLALRASVSTGFRAPSLAQIYFRSTFTDFVSGNPIDKIVANNKSPIARVLGIPGLKQENATNASLGLTASFGSFTATIDGYYVDIRDRVVLTGSFEDTDPDIGAELQALGVGAAQFFTNAIDTKTRGVDAVLSWSGRLGPGKLRTTFAANFNDMELGDITTNDKLKGKEDIYFGTREQKFLLASAPNSKLNLTLDYKIKQFGVNLRFIRFGEIIIEDFLGTDDVYSPRTVTDLTLAYDLTKNLSLRVGASNLMNVYPVQQDTETETGGLWDAVQMGANGTFYFARMGFRF